MVAVPINSLYAIPLDYYEMEGVEMRGCSDNCYLYWEDHSLGHVDPVTQITIEKELEKYKKGEPYDIALLRDIVRKRCLGGYLEDPDNLPANCRHYWELPEDLSVEARMDLLQRKKNKKWKLFTLIVGIVGIISGYVFGYLNFSKPSVQNLENKIGYFQTRIEEYKQEIDNKNETIKKLTLELPNKTEGGRK